MAYETALALVNQLHTQVAGLARTVVTATGDHTITSLEGLTIGTQAMQLGTVLLGLVQGADAQTKADILYVLEHGQWRLPQEG